ncbi:MAG: tRNA modification GTPase MnmE [Candidatus Tectimicrobiota bacterium]|nr:MAG: tRNA modification GTPase MnmE [Candidatus Tectomicrobia bacterium]
MEAVDTIAAIATPAGIGGIGVVRLSGPQTLAIVQQAFVRPNGRPLARLESHRVYYGYVVDVAGERVDEALLCVMRRPRSYTREDVAEISCHGGLVTTQRVLDAVLARGARVAEPGEFTKRAFLNGRLDLTQAEAVADLIHARTVASHRAALRQLAGELSRRVRALREPLLQVSVYLEASIDFPEEDLELLAEGALAERLAEVAAQLRRLLATYARGRALHEGVTAAIVGRPNVGKSSLLNALLGRERAIVSPQPGTTRDTIEATLALEGLLVRLVDTAGLRATTEAIEQEGVRRARAALEEAELVLLVLDTSQALSDDDRRLLAETAGKPRLLVCNKCDLPPQWAPQALAALAPEAPVLAVSARTGEGLPALERALVQQVFGPAALAQDEVVLTRARHWQSLDAALRHVEAARQGLGEGLPVECVAFEVSEALQRLAEVLGERCTGEVLERIFSSFCIGK